MFSVITIKHQANSKKLTFFGNQKGSTIIIALIAMAVFSGFILSVAQMQKTNKQMQKKIDTSNIISQIQTNIINTINDKNSWTNTLRDSANNGSMNCITSRNCGPVTETTFVLWSSNSTTYTNTEFAVNNSNSATAGYTFSGKVCNTFTQSGNSDCPIKINMTWSTIGCSPAPCDSEVMIRLGVLLKPSGDLNYLRIRDDSFDVVFKQTSINTSLPCSGMPDMVEIAKCTNPVFADYKLICTRSGYKCGQIYRNKNLKKALLFLRFLLRFQ